MSLSLLLVNVFLMNNKLSFSIKIIQIDMVLQFEKVVLKKKKKKKGEIVRCDFFFFFFWVIKKVNSH